jgi:hypothetical protein
MQLSNGDPWNAKNYPRCRWHGGKNKRAIPAVQKANYREGEEPNFIVYDCGFCSGNCSKSFVIQVNKTETSRALSDQYMMLKYFFGRDWKSSGIKTAPNPGIQRRFKKNGIKEKEYRKLYCIDVVPR